MKNVAMVSGLIAFVLVGCAAQVEAPVQVEKPSEHWTTDGGADGGAKELPILPLNVGGAK